MSREDDIQALRRVNRKVQPLLTARRLAIMLWRDWQAPTLRPLPVLPMS